MPTLLKKILNDLHKFGRNEKQYPAVSVAKNSLKSVVNPQKKMIGYSIGIVGETANYTASVEIYNINFIKSKPEAAPVVEAPKPVKPVPGEKPGEPAPTTTKKVATPPPAPKAPAKPAPKPSVQFDLPSFSKNPIRVRCTCDDFMFRFSYPMHQEGALIGMYKRYTPTGMYPPVNPDDRLGLCKHLWTFMLILNKAGMVKV